MNEQNIREAVVESIESIRRENPCLDFGAVHERSTAHRLAVHLESYFGKEWNIDCEYDRDGNIQKLLEGIEHCRPGKTTKRILPDLIVHHRMAQGRDHNLLVIELKKDSALDPCDDLKLHHLTRPDGLFQYQLGVFINVNLGQFKCTWYRDGKQVD